MRRLKTILLVLGLVFLAYAINTVGGSAAIALSLLQMRWWLLLALISTFVAQLMRTVAWGRVLDSYGGRISFATLWRVRLIGEAIGRDVPWVEVAPEQFRQAMLAQGLPEDVPDRMIGYWADRVEQPGPSSDAVEQILGRPALTFAQWAAEHVAAYRN